MDPIRRQPKLIDELRCVGGLEKVSTGSSGDLLQSFRVLSRCLQSDRVDDDMTFLASGDDVGEGQPRRDDRVGPVAEHNQAVLALTTLKFLQREIEGWNQG